MHIPRQIGRRTPFAQCYAVQNFMPDSGAILMEQVAVAACSGKGKNEDVILNMIDENPIRINMALVVSSIIASQRMVSVVRRKWNPLCQLRNDVI